MTARIKSPLTSTVSLRQLNFTLPKVALKPKVEQRLSKTKFKYEAEKIPYIISAHYTPDFILDTPNGKVYMNVRDTLDLKISVRWYPLRSAILKKDIRILFQVYKEDYVRWATKNGFIYAIKEIPETWLKMVCGKC